MPLNPSLTAGGALAALLIVSAPAVADGIPGDFDFYVLALSWSPQYCATNDDPAQCATSGRGFVVHGLWPEYESDYPDYCRSNLPRGLDRSTVAAIADVMPSERLAAYQWRKHGLCSGLGADDYFALTRAAAERVDIPEVFLAGDQPARLSPGEIETAFTAANPGLSEDGLSVQCRGGALTEIRVCMTRDLDFRACLEVDADSCRARSIAILPIE